MKFERGQSEESSEDLLNLTSMIDVVFTLLAFFIITTRFFGAERDAVVGPAGPAAPAGIVKGDLPQQITIRLLDAQSGSSASNAARAMRIAIGGQMYTEPAAITKQLREINLPQVQVVFAASPDLSVEQVTTAVEAALNSPMKRVSLRQAAAGELLAMGGSP
jgi:biopolymer transport protein ExbD